MVLGLGASLLLYTTVAVESCNRNFPGKANNAGVQLPYGAEDGNGPNATLFSKRYTVRQKETSPIDGPRPSDHKWSKGWGVPDGHAQPWGKGGLNPTPSEGPIPEYPYRYNKYGKKVHVSKGDEKYFDNYKGMVPARGLPDPYPNGYYYDENGDKKAAEEGQEFSYDSEGNKQPIKWNYYPNGYYYDDNGNKVAAKEHQDYYYDPEGYRQPVIIDWGYIILEDGIKVRAKSGQLTYVDLDGAEKPVRGRPPTTENPNPWENDPNLPDTWKALGPGFTGASPPPYAYIPANYGKPSYCFLPPVKGNCKEDLKRFAYNPFLDKCEEIPYSGCGGNENNFIKKENCEEKCVKAPGADCDPLAYDSIDLGKYMVASRRCGY